MYIYICIYAYIYIYIWIIYIDYIYNMSSMHDNDNRIILCDFSTSEFLHHFVREFSCKIMSK